MDSESMRSYNYSNTPVYTEEQMDEIIKAIKKMLGYQIEINAGSIIITNSQYNECIEKIKEVIK